MNIFKKFKKSKIQNQKHAQILVMIKKNDPYIDNLAKKYNIKRIPEISDNFVGISSNYDSIYQSYLFCNEILKTFDAMMCIIKREEIKRTRIVCRNMINNKIIVTLDIAKELEQRKCVVKKTYNNLFFVTHEIN